ncbi:MAG: DUF368 domain-containing protein [Rhodothermales bacterium]|nr:DUF368 domain-containing protein [Rhodothermales bacterium]
MLKKLTVLFGKGFAMGTANIIPGVSGGTIALLTGIYERLINAIKSFDLQAAKLLVQFRFQEFVSRVDLKFLAVLGTGVAVGVLTLARVLENLLTNHEVYIMSVFFGLILMSVYYVGKTIKHFTASVAFLFVIGTGLAAGIAFLNPATENASFVYIVVCGIAAICSMILPGLSGSFVLIILGNYLLVLEAINTFDLGILVPLGLGCVLGLVLFSRLLSFVFNRYHDQTISAMTGFILGSLVVIWPWKNVRTLTDTSGNLLLDRHGEPLIGGYEWVLPEITSQETMIALLLMIGGALAIVAVEKLADN